MNEMYTVATYTVIDDIYQAFLGETKYKPKMTPAEIVFVAIMAAKYFQNHLERALFVLSKMCYIAPKGCLSISRYNRQLHQHRDTLALCVQILDANGYNDKEAEAILSAAGVWLVPIRKKNMKRHEWEDEYDLRQHRKGIETVNSQLESMGINRLRARTNDGFYIKVLASLVALWATQSFAI